MTTILFRRGTAAQWTSANPVLASGEPGYETDTGKFKIGDGTTLWNSLTYENTGGSITESQITLSDVTTDDATTSRHGFLKKLSGISGTYMNGMGQWAALSGITEAEILLSDVTTDNATTGRHGFLKKLTGSATDYMDGSGNWSVPSSGGGIVTEAMISLTNTTVDNVSNVRHGFAPISPGDATKFLNGATNPDYALVKDSDLSLSDITNNNVDTTKHGFTPKTPGTTDKFLRGDGTWATFPGGFPAGATTKIFDSVLGSAAANIDSGASSIPGSYDVIEIWIVARTDEAVAASSMSITINGDTGGNYDRQFIDVTNTTVAGGANLGTTSWVLNCHGDGGTANYATTCRITIPSYALTTFYKAGEAFVSRLDTTGANSASDYYTLNYKSTSAITQIKVAAPAGKNLKTGSRLLVYGR